MPSPVIERLIELDGPEGRITLRRAWPRGPGHMVLEYTDQQGALVPGQWFADRIELRRVADETSRSARQAPPVVVEALGVLLQPGGADRRLQGLCELLARPGASLISHRPERRAVLRVEGPGGPRYARVLRPSRLKEALVSARHIMVAAGLGFTLPRILETDERRGLVAWSALEGAPLHELLGDPPHLVPAMHTTGAALRTLHALRAPPSAAVHDARAEQDLLREQWSLLEALQPAVHRRVAGILEPVLAGLEGKPCGDALLHRDLHDKQVMIDARGQAGLLDLDTVARGEPAIDLANMLAHLELRVMQGRCTPRARAEAGDAFVDGYAPSPAILGRVPEYRASALLRLACVYSYRPQWRHLVSALAEASCGALAHSI